MEERLLRRRQVEELTGLSRASIYRLMGKDRFPQPVKVSDTAVRWKLSDIATWIESRPVSRI
ncbi:MAG: AlpA family phage regulatory protein [Dehalococcoidia bacterium]|nr:AlpA family phage regulatory protein [Dehalococcoidia bacterium]